MRTSLAILCAIVAAVNGQRNNVDPRNAAILAEARYLSGDGSFGAAYVQEDGVEFKEETDPNGDRKGQYSYVDPNGKKITVQYTAGKNGFQVSGDHLPRAPVPSAAHQQAHQQALAAAPRAPPQYNSAPQYNSIQQAPRAQYSQQGGDEDGQYRPEIHEHPYQFSSSVGNAPQQQQYNSAPPPQRAPQQNFNQFNNYQQQQPINNYQPTTPQPTRFFPPGKLDLNRTPDGFNYQFQSNSRQ